MKKIITVFILICIIHFNGHAQQKYGNTLNLGVGIGGYSGYYGYVGRSLPVFNLNYEFDAGKNFTLAPFISFYSYTNNHYHETVIPIGVKGSYYFDDLLQAGPKWDFYLAGSLGYGIVSSSWDNGYNGNQYVGARSLFLDIHVGTEYHFNSKIGAFLDLSSGVSTIGLAFHK